MAKLKPRKFDSLTLAVIRRAKEKKATDQDWKKLQRLGAAVRFDDGRWVVTLPAIDALAEWNRQHRKAIADRMADTRTMGDGEVLS